MPAFFRCRESNYIIDCDNHKVVNLDQIISMSITKTINFFEIHFHTSGGHLKWRYDEEEKCELDFEEIITR
jgi:hypothetical protein